jgi:hypothetical protein
LKIRLPVGRKNRRTVNPLAQRATTLVRRKRIMAQVVVMSCTSAKFKSPDHDVAITMNLDLFDLAGLAGVLLIVIAYLLLQLDKLPSSSLTFSLLNAAGSLLIMVSLIFKFNASAFLIEVFWFLISLIGLTKWLISRKQASRERNA